TFMISLLMIVSSLSMSFVFLAFLAPYTEAGTDIDTTVDDDGGTTGVVCCFPAGTKIMMADGSYKNIEDVRVGDRVFSYDLDAGEMVVSMVSDIVVKVREGVYEINGGILSPTDDHPLYVEKPDGRRGWAAINPGKSKVMYDNRDAMQLEVGDRLLTFSGAWIEIYSIEFKPGKIVTYTFRVNSNLHNYFANGILVSNADACTNSGCVYENIAIAAPLDHTSIVGIMPDYTSDAYDSPLFSYTTFTSIDETPPNWEIYFIGYNHNKSHSTKPHMTLYENYVELKVYYKIIDNNPPWTNITTIHPENNEKISETTVTFTWEGHDDIATPDEIVYKYRLDPYETSWQPGPDSWTKNTTVTYKNLPRGDYIFRVRAMDLAHNVETVENYATNTRAFKIVEPTQILDETNSSFPISPSTGAKSLQTKYPLGGSPEYDFILIELYNQSTVFGKVWIFDLTSIEYELPSSFGTYGFSIENGAIISSDPTNKYLRNQPILLENGSKLMLHIVQITAPSIEGGGKSYTLSSKVIDNGIREDNQLSMCQLQIYGKNQDAWLNYFTRFLNFKQSSMDNTLIYNNEKPTLILLHSIIEIMLK
ncbi:MAG: hypothetical protein J7K62_01790, partial [Thermoplasmata archaeon]|nr:hypothetical protein [Thermoplasmata archaeon]